MTLDERQRELLLKTLHELTVEAKTMPSGRRSDRLEMISINYDAIDLPDYANMARQAAVFYGEGDAVLDTLLEAQAKLQ